MKRGLFILAVLFPGIALAQLTAPGAKPTPKPEIKEAAAAFAVRPPDEGSPFFSVREAAKALLNEEVNAQNQPNIVATYPRVKNSPDSATAILGRFFTDMFSSVKLGALRGERTTEKLEVNPGEFSLQEKRELDAAYSVRNNSNKIMRLNFSTSQRIDVVTRDSSGNVIEKWSDDRAFTPQEGIVIINPKERIQYDESVPTRDMKAGQSYSIGAGLTGYPEYDASRSVTPNP